MSFRALTVAWVLRVATLICVDSNDNGVGVVGACEDKGVDVAVICGRMYKEVWVDGDGFEVHKAMDYNEEVVSSLIGGLSEIVC